MGFSNPLGWLLSLILPLIILIHLRKQQFKEREISYLGLWDEVIEEVQGIKKNRINKYLLLLLQLLIGILIVMAFAGPIWIDTFDGERLIIALDTSLTMMAEENSDSRMEIAKEEIKSYMNTIDDDVSMDLIILGRKTKKIIEAGDKQRILKELTKIKATCEALNIKSTDTLLSSCPKPIILFTDKNLAFGDKQIKVGGEIENIGIIDGSYDYYNDTALFRIRNYGKKDKSLILELRDENSWHDIQRVNIPSNDIIDVNWINVPHDSQSLKMSIKKEDMLSIDNQFILPIGDRYKKKVLMIGENYFLQRALKSLPYINLKTVNEYNDDGGFDLYIINKYMKEKETSNLKKIWYLNPNENMLGEYLQEYGELKITDEEFSKDIKLREIYLKDFSYLKSDNDLQSILGVGERTVMAYKTDSDIKEIYSTIDLSKTNLSMKADFPILVDNIMKWFFKGEKNWYEPGDEIYVEGSSVKLQTSTKTRDISRGELIELDEVGGYELTNDAGTIKSFFVNPPNMENINYSTAIGGSEKSNTLYSNSLKRIDLKNIIIILLLIFMVLEWEVFKVDI
ncbi:MAG: VWA domain-containing protein [Maledivibacter sp.]|jgi:hypothetical protein|nr:VWA domain-containing protein [Maledivibacter sp.]